MGNKKKKSKKDICEYIFDDYIYDKTLTSSDEIKKDLQLLVDNDIAIKMVGSDDTYDDVSMYKVISLFMNKYNSSLKENRRRVTKWEIGGSGKYADDDDRLVELSKTSLSDGFYFAILENYQYAACKIIESKDGKYDIDYEFYIIGDKKEKWKKKFFKLLNKYEEIKKQVRTQRIYYTDSRYAKEVKFKSFDQLIFRDKDKVLKYVDNFIDNIPTYYNKYDMVPKLSILLYGKPGTGKSTFYRALADYMDIPSVQCITPDYFNTENESNGKSFIRDTIFALDDIDCICSSRDDNDTMDNAKILSSLLAFLDNPGTFYYKAKDGVHYPISIVIATTNYYDRLDDAVKRFGRFDLKIEMKDFNKEEAEDMCEVYGLTLDDVEDNITEDYIISPAQLQAKCLENIDQSIKKINE